MLQEIIVLVKRARALLFMLLMLVGGLLGEQHLMEQVLRQAERR